MQDLTGKITGSTLTAAEWNQLPQEVQNVITALGITLGSGDLNQLGKAIAGYVANGTFYTDSGVADAYVLSVVGSKQAATTYTDGFTINFVTSNPNTGAATVNVAGLGVKNITLSTGAAPSAGAITGRVQCVFDAGNDRFELIESTTDFAKINQDNSWSASQTWAFDEATTNTNYSPLYDDFSNFILTLTGNISVFNTITEAKGQSGYFVIIQDGTGGRTINWGTDYVIPPGFILSDTPNAIDIIKYFVTDTGSIVLSLPLSGNDGIASAWVNFNGTGVVAIRDSRNVSSITDNGVGDYTANFASSLANSDFSATVSGRDPGGGLTAWSQIGALNAAFARVLLSNMGGGGSTYTPADSDTVCITVHGGQ